MESVCSPYGSLTRHVIEIRTMILCRSIVLDHSVCTHQSLMQHPQHHTNKQQLLAVAMNVNLKPLHFVFKSKLAFLPFLLLFCLV